jgi:hypothetical protein
MSEEEIGQMGEAWLRSALLTQKYSHDPGALMARFEQIFILPPEPSAGNFLQILMVYFSKLVSIERDVFRDLVSELPKHKQPNVMTLYDSIIEEGIEKGLQKGREEGREETKKQTVLTGYKNGVSIDILCLLTGYGEVEVLQILAEAEDANQA